MVLSPVSLPNASLTFPRRPWPWFFALSVPLMATSPSHRENRPAGRVGDIGVYLVGQSPNVKVVPLGSSDSRSRSRGSWSFVRGTGPNATQEAAHHRDSRYHRHHNRGNYQEARSDESGRH